MEALRGSTLREIVAGVREGRWNVPDVVSCHAEVIAEREPQVQAWEYLELDRARTLASSAPFRAPDAQRPLLGAVLAVKDIIDVAGMPSRFGSPIYAEAPAATASAEAVTALERAGAIVLGKSVTTEFAYYTPGKTRNPWNAKHTPGGSSMGSAAAVACGMVTGALGTQTNGSVIRPAAFCGVVGFKPTYGCVSNHGTLDPWPSLDHTGFFARSVGDAALLASVIARSRSIDDVVPAPSRALRIAIVRSPVWHLAEPAQKDALESNAETLRHAGARAEGVDLPASFEHAHRHHRLIMAYEGARHFGELQRTHGSLMSRRFNELLDEGSAVEEPEYRRSLEAAAKLREAYAELMQEFDVIITPPAPGEAPGTLEETGSPAFCTIWSLLGVPAITMPVCLGPAGLPLGLQIVGRYGEDDQLLTSARWCEGHLPFEAVNSEH